MNYKQKYEEALERAKLSRLQLLNIGEEATEIEYIFPELRESEDEKIRKVLIKGFQHYDKECKWGEFTTTEILSWLKRQGEEKSTWSEEDEKQIRQIERIVKDSGASTNLQNKISDWLKSIKPQPHWKPSEEQMRVLRTAIKDYGVSHEKSVFESLYNDLEKL